MEAEQFTVRLARPDDDQAIAALVVEGFLDQFRHVFGGRMDRSLKVMERWIRLEHTSGGVTSLVVEGYADGEIAGSIGVRTEVSREDILARGLGDHPALLSDLLLPSLRGLHRAARDLPLLPAPGDSATPALGGGRPRQGRGQEVRGPACHRQQPWRPATLRG